MLNTIYNLIRPSLIAYSLLGTCLTLISNTAIQAKTPNISQTVAQLWPAYPSRNSEPDFISPYNQNSESYLVIVDNNDSRLLQQVRLVEPDAFSSNYKGRSVIQAGVFRGLDNAEERIRQLLSYGVSSRVYSQNTGREIINSYGSNNFNSGSSSNSNARNNNRRQRTKYYYVAIPENRDKLLAIENQIRQSAVGSSVGITVKNSPRGPHVAVGPFGGRSQAEQWNYYLRSLGLKNARVYYGK
ncbi:MAG: SPOR domain-containing protein [Cyanobacteria bacterium P01_D01_bin.50]